MFSITEAARRDSLAGLPESPSQVVELTDGLSYVAASPAMLRLQALVEQVARIEVPVLCLGESGTGKEVVARLLHKLSLRSHRTFLKVNCAALPGELLESELFGYEAGAFTGALRAKPGKFELCHKGSILLDEIAEMPPALQAKLLHVLQDQEFSRLGSCSRVRVDVRVFAATNVDVRNAIAAKRLREDLFYRLSTVVFHIPPLRERREDIPVLLGYYLGRFAQRYGVPRRTIPEELMAACLRYDWPGNVRELENFAKRYLILGDDVLGWCETPLDNRPGRQTAETCGGDLKSAVRTMKDDAEKAAISRALEETQWNRKQAARLLRISYRGMLTKMRRYGLGERGRARGAPG